jgi:hypothetical protein
MAVPPFGGQRPEPAMDGAPFVGIERAGAVRTWSSHKAGVGLAPDFGPAPAVSVIAHALRLTLPAPDLTEHRTIIRGAGRRRMPGDGQCSLANGKH